MNSAVISHHKTYSLSFITFAISIAVFLDFSIVADSHAQTSTPAWNFVSSPDWFNRDIADLSGSRQGVPKADGWDVHTGLNGVSSQMEAVYHSVISEMAAYDPEVYVVTGDLVAGYWFNTNTLDMFDPVSRNRLQAIDKAADIYYGWYKWLFDSHAITPILAAVGDHEIAGDDWQPGTEWSYHVQNMKSAFGRNVVDNLSLRLKINGANARPYGTPFEDVSYAYQHRNLLVITVDVFRQDDPGIEIHAIHGSVSPDVEGAHLDWLSALLKAADRDASIDHVIVQGHTPVLRPVRMHNTSGMMLVNREDSAFWQLLRQHDHRHGGKVRIYFGGEVHAVTVSKDTDSDLIQLVHGSPPIWQGLGNYIRFRIFPDRIEVELRRFRLYDNGSSKHWQPSLPVSPGVSSVDASFSAGFLTINTSGSKISYNATGSLAMVDQRGLTIHFDFDQTTASGNFSNRGSIGNDFYEGVKKGGVATVPGIFGSAIQLNGSTTFVESGRGNITEGESRSVSAWIKSTFSGKQGVFSYGRDKYRSSLNGRFNILLSNGRPMLNIGSSIDCFADGAPFIADGQWHNIAVVLTDKHHNSCAHIRFYVDGAAFPANSVNSGALLDTLSWANIRIGAGVGGRLGNEPDDYFNGTIDDIAMWGSPLTDSKIKAIATAGNDAKLRYDASAMDLLFDLFDAQHGSVKIAKRTWIYTQGLKGTGGDVLTLNNGIAIQLDTLGNGVIGQPGGCFPYTPSNGKIYMICW